MSPCPAINNVMYRCSRYIVASGYCRLGNSLSMQGTNFDYITLGNLSSRAFTSIRITVLAEHISYIFGLSTKKKMIWIAARRIIALMACFHAIWNWTKMNFPRSTMRQIYLIIAAMTTIAVLVSSSCPLPAFIWTLFVYLFPKAIQERFPAAMSTDKAYRLACDPSPFSKRLGRNTCFLATTAMAISVGDFVEIKLELGEFWSRIAHVASLLGTTGQSQGRYQRRLVTFIGDYRGNYNT